jgi:MATE family multidrug resistance protein
MAGAGELLQLAWPFVLSTGCWTLQLAFNRVLLSQAGCEGIGAVTVGTMLYWTLVCFLSNVAGFASILVSQYVGAGRPGRVGPVVWQAIHFSLAAGVAFLSLVPLADRVVALVGHAAELQALESAYLGCLMFAAPPTLVVAAVNSFFAGRGDSLTVMLVNGTGLAVNCVLSYAFIFGACGFPALGVAGAALATTVGSLAAALLALGLMLRPCHNAAYNTRSGWRLDLTVMVRLLRFGLPAGLMVGLDYLTFTVFLLLVGRLGTAELTATSIAFTLNLIQILPMLGLSQAVAVLVARRLGEGRPNLARRTAWIGLGLGMCYMAAVAVLFFVAPGVLAEPFRAEQGAAYRGEVARHLSVVLRFVAVYSLFDCVTYVLAAALRGAGDTRFATGAALMLSWTVLVMPTWAACRLGWGLYWAWAFASLYVILLALAVLVRFRWYRWQSLGVIEVVGALPGSLGGAGTNPQSCLRAARYSRAKSVPCGRVCGTSMNIVFAPGASRHGTRMDSGNSTGNEWAAAAAGTGREAG